MRSLCFLLLAALASTRVAAAQQTGPAATPRGTISGSVIDATTGLPLTRSTVTLTPADGFSILADVRSPSASFSLSRSTTTSPAGEYRFGDLPIGAYRLYVQRLGYAPAALEVRLGESGTSPLSIGLVVLPVRLRPVEVRATKFPSLGGNRVSGTGDDERLAALRDRQRLFLSTDARELTFADVTESATLGGNDVLRALQRLPGVTQFDDWSAKLWVRGNRWDHNRLYYDDLPLFDPLQALGRSSGVTMDAIGGAFLHPGVRPVSLGGEGATRIDLRSRPAGGAGKWRGSAQLSRFGASGALERERTDGTAGFAVSAQHSLGEWLPRHAPLDGAIGERGMSDAQVTFRGDVDFGGGKGLETSGLLSRDGNRDPSGRAGNQEWGNVAGRLTFRAPLAAFATSHTIGITHFSSRSDRSFANVPADGSPQPVEVTIVPVSSGIDYVTFSGRVTPASPSLDSWVAGYDLNVQRSSLDGPRNTLYWSSLVFDPAFRRDALTYGSVWTDRRLQIGERITLEGGLRLDVGGPSSLDALRPAASAQGRFVVAPNTWLSVGAARTHQYVQGVDQPITARSATAPSLWFTAGRDVPTMSIDNGMVGLERWLGIGVIVAANGYVRHTTGLITADPTPGPLTELPLFVAGTESAHGVELSARKLTGRVTGLLAYSYGKATTLAGGLSFVSPADRPHALDAATSIGFGNFRVGGAYALTTGAPFTRVLPRAPNPGMIGWPAIQDREAPNGRRFPAYSSLDLMVDYARSVRGASLSGFAGVQNVLGRTNKTWYQISGYCENDQVQATTGPECRDSDLLYAPVKFAPTIGLRFVF